LNNFTISINTSPKEYAIRIKKLYIYYISHIPRIIITRLCLIISILWSFTSLVINYRSTHEISIDMFFCFIISLLIALFLPHIHYYIIRFKKPPVPKQRITFYNDRYWIQYINKQEDFYYRDLHKIKVLKTGFIFYLNDKYEFTHVGLMYPTNFFTEVQFNSLKSWVSGQ